MGVGVAGGVGTGLSRAPGLGAGAPSGSPYGAGTASSPVDYQGLMQKLRTPIGQPGGFATNDDWAQGHATFLQGYQAGHPDAVAAGNGTPGNSGGTSAAGQGGQASGTAPGAGTSDGSSFQGPTGIASPKFNASAAGLGADVSGALSGGGQAGKGFSFQGLNPGIGGMLNTIYQQLQGPGVSAQDITQSPEYKSEMDAINAQESQSQAALRQDLASRGLLNSTMAVQAFSNNDAAYLSQKNNLIPQLMNSANTIQNDRAQREQNLLGSAITAYDTQAQQAINRANATGTYLSPQLQSLYDEVLQDKSNYAQAQASGQDPSQYASDAQMARQAISAAGGNPDLVGSDVTLQQAGQNAATAGSPTLAAIKNEAQQFQWNQDYQLKLDQFNFTKQDRANVEALTRESQQQTKDYHAYLEKKGLTDQQGKVATNGYIAKALSSPDAMSAIQYITDNATQISNDGGDINQIMAAVKYRFPAAFTAPSTNASSGTANGSLGIAAPGQ